MSLALASRTLVFKHLQHCHGWVAAPFQYVALALAPRKFALTETTVSTIRTGEVLRMAFWCDFGLSGCINSAVSRHRNQTNVLVRLKIIRRMLYTGAVPAMR
eukprot:121310-Pyramimonas_sp.AAC.1